MRTTIIEALVLGLLGLALGFGVNSVRTEGSLKPCKNYFAKTVLPGTRVTPGKSSTTFPNDRSPTAPSQIPAELKSSPKRNLEHNYQIVGFEDVVESYKSPNMENGLYLFIDARDNKHFSDGHIPGAIRSFPYEFESYSEHVLSLVNGREKVIIYCGGGDCEDSIFMCREFEAASIPVESIFLFKGGWEEWTRNKMPIETGAYDHGE